MAGVDGPAHLARTRAAYDTVAEHYAALLPDLAVEASSDVAMIKGFTARCLGGGAGLVADVGCGAGRVTAHLAGAGLDVLGLDLSAAMVDVARRTHPRLRFEVAAMQALPLDDASLAGALCWYGLIHTPPDGLGEVAVELARVVRTGGHVLAAFQVGDGDHVDRSEAYGHPVTLTSFRHDPDHVRDVLAAAGFDVAAPSTRGAQGHERSPQAFVTGVRSAGLAHRP